MCSRMCYEIPGVSTNLAQQTERKNEGPLFSFVLPRISALPRVPLQKVKLLNFANTSHETYHQHEGPYHFTNAGRFLTYLENNINRRGVEQHRKNFTDVDSYYSKDSADIFKEFEVSSSFF
ncbi:hypothetical protein AVEN_91423-1 [Araneus ventricosus]|uniref:Uncharacterized protein n=1 Tax=Araneus ventricosus TaxID=182803 RepID=A0A4Y2MID0_ARAVE|nr:hypothetical protein AVEN_213419-1 [Araneus ventricosus]GBN26929.1 hypothetical protein AVEN_91423-1 [Araneus ventricosus]